MSKEVSLVESKYSNILQFRFGNNDSQIFQEENVLGVLVPALQQMAPIHNAEITTNIHIL